MKRLYDGPLGRRSAARDYALYLAETKGVEPFFYDLELGQMYATGICAESGLVTYRPASTF